MKKYFDYPTQVYFWEGESYAVGIAYHDEIICACCGCVYEVDEVIRDAQENNVVALCKMSWVEFKNEIGDPHLEQKIELVNAGWLQPEELEVR